MVTGNINLYNQNEISGNCLELFCKNEISTVRFTIFNILLAISTVTKYSSVTYDAAQYIAVSPHLN